MVRHFPVKSTFVLVSGLVWLILTGLLVGPPTGPLEASSSSDTLAVTRAGGDLVITRAEMNGGRARIEGQGAQPDAAISVDGVAMGDSDAQGDFRVEADGFGSASCQVTVSDGVNSAGASLDGCTPTAPAPAVDPVILTLTPTGVIPGASGKAELALGFVADLGVNGLLANAEARGLTLNVSFSMCVDATFIDDDQSITGMVVMNEGVESSLVSLSGLTVTIRQGIGCGGTVVLQATVP